MSASMGRARAATALRFAARELRGNLRRGLRGFGIFVACLALGVAAIAGVSALGRSFDETLSRQGDVILGGDLALAINHTAATPEERAYLEAQGRVSEVATLRAMARSGDGATTALVEVKAVDAAYPLVGRLTVVGGDDGRTRLGVEAGADGPLHRVLVEEAALDRLKVAVGDVVTVGTARLKIAGVIAEEPDRLSAGLGFGPRLMMTRDALDATGLLAPGSLVRWQSRLLFSDRRDVDGAIARVSAGARSGFPQAGWEIRSRRDAAPGTKATIERFVQFLTLVGLTTLVIGGVGVANAVAAHLERRRSTIAIWKALGATGGFVAMVHGLEIGAIALVGIGLGLGIGALVPFVLAGPFGDALGLALQPVLAPAELAAAGLEGLLTAAMFVAAPLAAAVATRPAVLLRDGEPASDARARIWRWSLALVPGAALVALVLLSSPDRRITVPYLVVTAVALVGLRLAGEGLVLLARRLPRPPIFELRSAMAAIGRPGAPTASIVLSLGLGATLVAALVQIESGLTTAIARTLPGQAPSFFFLDVPARDADAFRGFLDGAATGARIEDVPMLRGRIVRLKGVPAEEAKVAESSRFVLAGDRGITFAARPPEGTTITAGNWWSETHAGPPQVSFDDETARGLGLGLGDAITVNVLGRDIEARVANLRHIEWDRLSINFFMVFSPDTFRGAPVTRLVTVAWPGGGSAEQERTLFRAVVERFPTITAIRVKDALAQVDALVRRSAQGISVVAGFALVAAVLVLGGALAARSEARIRDAAILTAIGATRRRLMSALAIEFALVAVVGGVFAGVVGTLAARWVVAGVMKLPFVAAPGLVAATLAAMAVLTIGLGLLSTRTALRARPAEVLRAA
ncbi:FtsX-like permease family protein [Siculibacillus lacustris]|uniref:FtsX-like permease family protein n=1 Tax=Siculibacillus lacustris TaxID=1549641 RepID=A0A4Q9VV23_9HYPH|nr:FtsX-like permease family protein [Siculibacillus lacustris]TBW39969.1 FtsX-like permease family protein [Siculibacillus lacustris]